MTFFTAKTLSRLAVVLCALPLVIGGCGGQAAAGTVTLRIWYSTDDPVERGWSQELARRYQAAHPNTHVQLSVYSFEDINTKLQLALSAGDPPDLAYVTPRGPGIPAYVGAHKLLDLTRSARIDAWASKLRPGLLTSYNQPFSYLGIPHGHVVAVPTSLAAVGVLYNKTLLRRLGLGIPASIAAFEGAASRAAAAGYTPIGIGNGDGWLGDDWYLTLVNALVPRQKLEPEQRLDPHFSFRRPPFLKAGDILQRWAGSTWLTPNFGGLDAQEGLDLFFHGSTLFQLISSSEDAQILRDEQRTRMPVGVFAFPAASGPRVMPASGYLGWVIPAASPHQSQAISFINSLLTPSTSAFLLQQGLMPAERTVLSARNRSALAARGAANAWQSDYLRALDTARPGIYLDAAPIANLNATMEANVQLLLQGYEQPTFLVKSLQEVYSSHGHGGSTTRIDGEF
jgi:raffinose/stachyose/melibiose transport system substrate-binding protein